MTPPSLFRKSKLAILLSLVSCPFWLQYDEPEPIIDSQIHLSFVTDYDQPWIARLLKEAASFRNTDSWTLDADTKRGPLLDVSRHNITGTLLPEYLQLIQDSCNKE